ncbi:BRCA1-A complex subunit RAP80 isoform X1 [Ictalurus punctatus]|uniref:BRCA1-A complex subunit RAP80 n=1 Tax=Ictalurus punctatus TaxID=7998 RepID=A0A2D0SZ33_ICTPU|nr:BRCA1-A complex subunit RAP80 isoform X1 [Ictalurus punctatus]
MPRRKRTTGQNERRRKVRRRDDDDDDDNDNDEEDEDNDTLVISDSGSDEEYIYNKEEDCAFKVTPRTVRRLEREKKTHVQDMTEDEMLDLALRLSKQEASTATQREQVDDDNMRKAIAESLQVSCSQASETSSVRVRSAAKPHHDRDTVTARVRCKLSFPSKDGKDGGSDDNDGDVPAARTSALTGSEEVRPLPPMPDLSQRTSSQPSPPSPSLPSVPSAASQESHSSCPVKQEFNARSPEDERSQSDSPLKRSPVYLRRCVVRLSQNPPSRSESPRNIPCTNNSSVDLTSPDRSQNGPPPPKSPVFNRIDSKRCTKLTRDEFSDRTPCTSFTDSVCKPEDASRESSSHKSQDSPKRLPGSRKAQPPSHVSVPEGDEQPREVVKVKDEPSRGTGLSTVSDGAPNLDVSSLADAKSLEEFTSHMVLHLSDEDEEEEEENEKIIPPSPVFPQDRASRAGQPKLSPTQPCCSPPTAITTQDSFQTKSPSQAESEQTKVSRKSTECRLTPPVEGKEDSLVSYYWGVPFCPKGQSPDDYTRVILAQLEVYEKSLKEAQRQLLRKADWGLPVFPCPVEKSHGRRLKRHRAPLLLEEEEEDEDEDKGRDEEEKAKKKKVERKEREESQPCSEDGAKDSQHETYFVLSSPETQEELGQRSPPLFGKKESTTSAKASSCRKPISQDLSEDTRRQSEPDERGEDVQNGSFDVERAVCPETQMTEDETPELMVTSPAQPQLQAESDVMEVDEVTDPPAEAEERMEQERPGEEQSWMASVPSHVECPMCTRLFSLGKIEMHAAYCNGTSEDQDQQDNFSQGSSRRKSVRRTATEDDVRSEKSEQREKCFLCNKLFTSKEYSHHVDQCLQHKTPGSKQGNGLLSALNRTETVHLDDSGAGPSNTTSRNNRGLADTSVTPGDGVDSQAPGYYVSSSPIKSFTPISEITDCLINFRQQNSDRTRHRLERKRKFKR